VVAGTDGNALLIQNSANVGSMNAIDDKGNNGGFMLRSTDNTQAFNFKKLFGSIFQQLLLSLSNIIYADVREIVDSGPQSNTGNNGRSACLKFVRKLVEGGAVKRHFINLISTASVRRHSLQILLFSVEDAKARGAAHLMSRESIKVGIQLLYIHRSVGSCLCPI